MTWAMEQVLDDAGYEVASCHGPTGNARCELVETGHCDLQAGADVIVNCLGGRDTGGHDPAVVGREVGDELERLGFTLASLSANEVLATRDDGRLTVTIHTNPQTIEVDGRRLFPTTSGDDVVVEFVSG